MEEDVMEGNEFDELLPGPEPVWPSRVSTANIHWLAEAQGTTVRGTAPVSARWRSAEGGPVQQPNSAPGAAHWVSGESASSGSTAGVSGQGSTELAASPTFEVLQVGDSSKPDPFTILFVANPVIEAPWNTGRFEPDPILANRQAYNVCVTYCIDTILGRRSGQSETIFGSEDLAPKIRILSLFPANLPIEDANAFVAQDGASNLLIARRDTIRNLVGSSGLSADIVFCVSNSSSHDRASAWYASDDDARGGVPFVLDGVNLSHRYYAIIPGVVAIHSSARSLTPLHEFGHALSSYTNGLIVDLYVDNLAGVNNKRGRPIPATFSSYAGTPMKSDISRNGIGYPTQWQSYHCELRDTYHPAVMDNYYLSSDGADNCRHDEITLRFLVDRIRAKMSR